MRPRDLTRLLVALVPTLSAAAAPPVVWQDVFLDGSGRRGPALVTLPGGTCRMGSRPGEPGAHEDEPVHDVRLPPYALGRFEITWEQWAAFLNDEGNRTEGGVPWWVPPRDAASGLAWRAGRARVVPGQARRPAVGMSWRGAQAYARWLTRQTGQEYRLPSEAEWECAARAGSESAFPWGDQFDPGRLQGRATPGASGTRDVGSYAPNAAGLHDLLGNVWEWVADCFTPDAYARAGEQAPRLFDPGCLAPVVRGGSFRDGPEATRPGRRANAWWWGPYDGVGLRVARAFATSLSDGPRGRVSPPR